MVKRTKQEEDAPRFRELTTRVCNAAVALIIWRDLLSPAQRAELGDDLEFAYGKLGTLRMWMAVTKKSRNHAFIDLADKLDLISRPDKSWLQKYLKVSENGADLEIPRWNNKTGKLWFEGQIVRSVSGQAKNLRKVLNAFEVQNWLEWIKNPIARQAPTDFGGMLRTLNKGLRIICFRADGTGQGIIWERRSI